MRALGVIDLPTMQKKMNLHYSLSLDLFGSEVSTNAANFYNSGLKGRFQETKIDDDHRLTNDIYQVLKLVDGEIKLVDEPALTALNMRLRDDYTADCAKGVERWNKIIEKAGVNFRLELPHIAFHRQIGEFSDVNATPTGIILERCRLGQGEERLSAVAGRRRLHLVADDAGERARQVRQLDRAAEGRHRQQARRFRICEDRGVTCYLSWGARQRSQARTVMMDVLVHVSGTDRPLQGGERRSLTP